MSILKNIALAAALGITVLASLSSLAQNADPGEGNRAERPVSPLVVALDTNKNGEIDASEIANAVAALKTLDKNGDGKLSADEIRPPRREGGRGAGGAPKGDRPGRGKTAGQ